MTLANSISILFILAGLFFDMQSCYLGTKKLIKGFGASGVPGIPFIIYLLVFLNNKDLVIFSRFLDILIFFIVHVCLQYGIPFFVSKVWSKQT